MKYDFTPYEYEGTLVQANGDAGDSANRTGLLNVCEAKLNEYFCMANHTNLEVSPGRYARGLKSPFDHANYMTRDQMAPLECAIVMDDCYNLLKDHIKLRLRRGLFHFSTYDPVLGHWKFPDPVSPLELAVIIRGMRWWALYPLLPLLDLLLLPYGLGAKHDGQHVAFLAVARKLRPTFVGKLMLALTRRRLKTIQAAIRNYHAEGPGRNGLQPLGNILCQALEAICSTK